MKITNFESPETASSTADPCSESPAVTEALSLLSSPTGKLADNSTSLKKVFSQFLDTGDVASLYGKSAVEPVSVATTADQGVRKQDRQAETAKPSESKPQLEQAGPASISPDRLEEIGKKHPEEVTRYHESLKNAEHKKLEDWADRTLQEPERSGFKNCMNAFEARAKRDGLAPADVTVTYKELQRLTSATGEKPLTPLERTRIAQQVMYQLAVPTSIDQGFHNTCNVTTVEARTYTRTPYQAVRLVADVALNGEYRANDGTVVKLDPKAHGDSKTWPQLEGQRCHASEIFQVTAVNLHYAKYNAEHGTNLRYEQVEPKAGDNADTGERLMDYSVPGGKEVTNAKGPVRSPNLEDGELTVISNAISSRWEPEVTLAHDKYHYGDKNVSLIHSKEELGAKLKALKEQGKLPVIIRVNTNAEPFYTDSGAGTAGGSGGAHVVTITDYDERTGQIKVDNQWGSNADHGNKPIHVHDLFTAMQSDQGIEDQLRKDVKWDREHHTVDPSKEQALLRMLRLKQAHGYK